MILQALTEYYERKSRDPDSGIAPLGWERKELPYLLLLNSEAELVDIQDTREAVGKKKVAKAYLVPQSVKRTAGVVANLLWDNSEYILGVAGKENSKAARVEQEHRDFLRRLAAFSSVPAVQIVQKFLCSSTLLDDVAKFPAWEDIRKECPFLSFKIAGSDVPVFQDPEFRNLYEQSLVSNSEDESGRCLVSGEIDTIATTHPSIRGVLGANTTGGNVVSFNFPAACSFGKTQGANAPIGERAAFSYTTALNTLLGKGSRQRLMVGDSTVVFWASCDNIALEKDLLSFFDDAPSGDDTAQGTGQVEALLTSVRTGSYHPDDGDAKFYVLGLAPNSARLSVRFWHDGTVAEMARNFADYFEDLRIAHGPKDKEHLSLFRLLLSTASLGKTENIIPNLAGNVMRSILEGLPFPETLQQSVLMRIKADHEISYPRAKLLKGYINRRIRFHQLPNERMLTVSLDKENTNIGYRLGRLFSVLEKIQEEANPGINATIRDKFYASASATPATVFGTLMRLKNHHLAKLENPGRRVTFEQLLGEILYQAADKPGVSRFPAHLSLPDQSQFAIGYYHQRQDFFTRKSSSESSTEPL